MKLNSFKFQDGKVLWLPEYPGTAPNSADYEPFRINQYNTDTYNYFHNCKLALASAIEVAPEDIIMIKRLVVESIYKNGQVGDAIKVITSMWQPEKGKVYSAECEMEIAPKRYINWNQVARLKPN